VRVKLPPQKSASGAKPGAIASAQLVPNISFKADGFAAA
jgi:hypothetical protein